MDFPFLNISNSFLNLCNLLLQAASESSAVLHPFFWHLLRLFWAGHSLIWFVVEELLLPFHLLSHCSHHSGFYRCPSSLPSSSHCQTGFQPIHLLLIPMPPIHDGSSLQWWIFHEVFTGLLQSDQNHTQFSRSEDMTHRDIKMPPISPFISLEYLKFHLLFWLILAAELTFP